MRNVVRTELAPIPVAPLSQAVIHQGLVYVSGQGAIDPKTGAFQPAGIRAEAAHALENVETILKAAGSSLEKVLKVNVYLRDIGDFAAMNEVYQTYFSAPHPARTVIQAAALPRGFTVEIECVAAQ